MASFMWESCSAVLEVLTCLTVKDDSGLLRRCESVLLPVRISLEATLNVERVMYLYQQVCLQLNNLCLPMHTNHTAVHRAQQHATHEMKAPRVLMRRCMYIFMDTCTCACYMYMYALVT